MTRDRDLDLPPARPLPPEVRARLRHRLHQDLNLRQRTALQTAAPGLVAAAAAAALVGAATFLGTADRGSETVQPAAGGSAPQVPADAGHLDRCRAAAGADLTVRQAVTRGPLTVLATGDGDALRFCQLTDTTVTLSEPAAAPAPGSIEAVLWSDSVIAGYAPGARQLLVGESADNGGGALQEVLVNDGMFVHFRTWGPDATVTAEADVADDPDWVPGEPTRGPEDGPALQRPADPVVIVDRPERAADRTSPAGRQFDQCLARLDRSTAVPAADTWVPGAAVETGGADGELSTLQIARSGTSAAVCETFAAQDDKPAVANFQAHPLDDPSVLHPLYPVGAVQLVTDSDQGTVVLLAGVAPPAAATVELTGREGSVSAVVLNGTFAAALPETSSELRGEPEIVVDAVARDAAGGELFRGRIR